MAARTGDYLLEKLYLDCSLLVGPQEKPKVKRAPSAYNKYISKEVPNYMKANPEATRTDAFRAVAAMWKDDPSNPKNAPKPSASEPEANSDAAAEATEKQEGKDDTAAAADTNAAAPAASTEAAEATEAAEQPSAARNTATTADETTDAADPAHADDPVLAADTDPAFAAAATSE